MTARPIRPLIRAVAWDIDGTLVDSEPLHQDVLVEVCAALGDDLSDLAHDHFRGVHMPDVWAALAHRFAGRTTEEAWMEAIVARYVERAPALRPLLGAVEVMASFRKRGLRQVCVSNSGRRVVDANLAALGVAELIDFSISLDDVERGKPDPFPYALAARRLGFDPAEMAAVEDSVTGARSAALAGLRVLGIDSTGGRIPGAEATVARLGELEALVLSEAVAVEEG